ncbi:MAG: hypothetical protein M1399_03660 [Actinobacteria bacterium]|nr:hypothetical protein [Actinomycetota bacterium]
MSTQLQQYEGSALEPLLERIHREHGPLVKIVKAERAREGGVLGFFAREMFRLTVDVKAASRPQEHQRYDATGKPARSMQDAGQAQQSGTAQHGKPVQGNDSRSGQPARRMQVGTQVPSTVQGPPATSVLADTLAMDDVLDISASPTAVAGTQAGTSAGTSATGTAGAPSGQASKLLPGRLVDHDSAAIQPGFAEVLARVAYDMDMDTSPVMEEGVPAGMDTTTSGITSDTPCESYGSDFAEGAVFESDSSGHTLGNPARQPELGSDLVWPGSVQELSQDPSGPPPAHQPAGNIAPQAMDGPSTQNRQLSGPPPTLTSMLAKAGIPEQLLESGEIASLNGDRDPSRIARALVDTFNRLPSAPPPPSLPGSLLAIVGDLQRSRRLATEIATDLGLDPATMPVVSVRPVGKIPASLTARSALEVAERAPGWRRNGSATVVVVVSPLVGGNRSWARLVLAAMKPTAVWGIAEALYKTEEIAAWAETLGGMDALVLSEVRHSISPASATATGIPIARLDEGRASPERWATVVGDLLNRTFVATQGTKQP